VDVQQIDQNLISIAAFILLAARRLVLSWQSSIMLRKGERIVCYWSGDCETSQTVVVQKGKYVKRYKPHEVKERKNGFLVLTNERLVWLEQRGIFGKSYHALFEMPLEHLKGISMGGAIMKYVSITDAEGEQTFHLMGIGSRELDSFKQTVFEQVEARKRSLEEEKQKDRVHILLDFSFLKSYMEKGGLVLQTFKCPECGASVKFPDAGSQTVCGHCGANIYANDVFKKIKDLIG